MNNSLIYKSDVKILRDGSLNIAYDVENLNLIKLSPIEVDILEYADRNGTQYVDFVNHFSYYGKEEILNSINELVKVKLLSANNPVKGISQEEIINFEETFYNRIKKQPLLQILLNVTHRCNLACRYCYADYGDYGGPATHMKKEIAKKSVDFLLKASENSEYCRITFFGGEPLLNFDLIKYVIRYAKEQSLQYNKKVLFGMTTNGVLLDEDKIEYIHKENIDVTLSIDGPEDIQNENRPFKRNRKIESYKIIYPKIKKFIKEAKKNGRFFAIRSTLTKPSLLNIKKVIDFFDGLNIERIKFAYAENAEYPDQKASNYMFITDEVFSRFRKDIHEVCNIYIEEKLNNKKPHYGPLLFGALNEVERKLKRYNICRNIGSKFVAVSVNGDIFPCHRFISFPETKIGDIWNGIDKNWLKRMKKIHIFNSEICSQCWLRYICGGMCPATNFLLGKNFTLPKEANPVYCKGIKILFEEAFILYAKLKEIHAKLNLNSKYK